jgi:thymidine phosphorylase
MTVPSHPAFDAIDVLRTKRDGGQLSAEQIRWIIGAYTGGTVPDEQMSALLMAVFFRGMSPDELAAWTQAMIDSGERKDLSSLGRPTADKHSTGGVGDKITLPLAPLVAACGVAVPQLSGRGLGHTGGTLDKLEAIPGWRADVHEEAYLRQLREVGAVICAAGNDLAPADKKLYALRDVTATVESIPLIASSIMSKKIAEGADALVLDVKTGSGAFMKDPEASRELARTMVGLGEAAGVRTVALVTAMDRPLGRAAGNAVEVAESVEVLAGGGPADVIELTLALAREMLAGAGREDVDPAEALADGRAMDVWRRMIAAQGGDPDAPLPKPAETHVVTAPASGTLTRLDAYALGVAAWRLGAGRARKEDPVSAAAGVVWTAGVGDRVTAGQPLLELQTDDANRIPRALEALEGAIGVDTDDRPLPLILDRITA